MTSLFCLPIHFEAIFNTVDGGRRPFSIDFFYFYEESSLSSVGESRLRYKFSKQVIVLLPRHSGSLGPIDWVVFCL